MRPAERGHQIGHRRDVDQRDVQPDAADPDGAGLRRPGRRRSGRTAQCRRCAPDPAGARPAPPPATTVVQRRPFGPLVRSRRRRPSRRGARTRPSRPGCRTPHQPFEGVALGRSRPRPRRQSHPVAEPAGEVEKVHGARRNPVRRRSGPAPGADWRDTTRRHRGGTGTSAGRACPRRSRRAACAASIRKSATPLLAAPRAARRTTRRLWGRR